MISLLPFVSNAQETTQEQRTVGWSMENPRLTQYSVGGKNIYRHDNLGHMTLMLAGISDSLINVYMYDYDAVGNFTDKTTFSLHKNKENPIKYDCRDCYCTSKEFVEITQKLFDRLDNKK